MLRKYKYSLLIVMGLVVGLAGCQLKSADTKPEPPVEIASGRGSLEGRVSIGPLCGDTQFPGKNCEPTEEHYRVWEVGVYQGKTKVGRLWPKLPQGDYQIDLPAGVYTLRLDLKMPPGLGGVDLPVDVTVRDNETTRQDIHINTGIA